MPDASAGPATASQPGQRRVAVGGSGNQKIIGTIALTAGVWHGDAAISRVPWSMNMVLFF